MMTKSVRRIGYSERLEIARKSLTMTKVAIAEEYGMTRQSVTRILESEECIEFIEALKQESREHTLNLHRAELQK